MQNKLASNSLIAGMRLPGAVFDERGKFVFPAGKCITTDDIEAITSLYDHGLFGDEHWPGEFLQDTHPTAGSADEQTAVRIIKVDDLTTGMRLPDDVYDSDSDVLLLAAGSEITPRFLQLLRARGIRTIRTRPSQPQPEPTTVLHTTLTRRLDALLRDELKKRTNFKPRNLHDRPRLRLDDFKAEASRGLEQHSVASDMLADINVSLERGRSVPGRHVMEAISVFADQVALDVDLLPFIVSRTDSEGEYLFDHCVNTSLISMSLAAQAGLGKDRIVEIGFGALVQDLGMLAIPREIRLAPRKLTPSELREVHQHPVHTLKKLENITEAPLNAGFITYQSHERCDGKGYPRQHDDRNILVVARIVGIADSFAAMTHDRPYRKAMLPYQAAKEILRDVWKFDRPTVRTFLDTVGLFPIGSCVELNTGTRARVIRIIPGAHTRPVIEPFDEHGRPTGRLLSLVSETDMSVVRAIGD